MAQTVTVSAAEDANGVDETVALTHTASGDGYGSLQVLPQPIDRLQLLQPPPRPRAPLGRDSSGRR